MKNKSKNKIWDYQGKRKKQIESSEKFVLWSWLVLWISLIFAFLSK